MSFQILQNRKLVFLAILCLVFVLFVPLGLWIFIEPSSITYNLFNEIVYIYAYVGERSGTRVQWMWIRNPLFLFLAIAAFVATVRLHQQREKSYPTFSASLISLVLWGIPIYYFVQFFSLDPFRWSEIILSEPVSIGFCGILFLVFVVLPSIEWYSTSISMTVSTSGNEVDKTPIGAKRAILTPKRGSFIAFLAAFLLPGIILWESFSSIDVSYLSSGIVGFLLQLFYGVQEYLSSSSLQFGYTIQNMASWNFIAVSIICCLPSLLFAWFVMRYLHGRISKKSALLVGVIAEAPPITYAIVALVFEYGIVVIPFPAAFITGLLVMRFTPAIEPRTKVVSDDEEIKIPLKTLLLSRFRRHREIAEETQETGSGEGQGEE